LLPWKRLCYDLTVRLDNLSLAGGLHDAITAVHGDDQVLWVAQRELGCVVIVLQ
jgi:hypothetical protein